MIQTIILSTILLFLTTCGAYKDKPIQGKDIYSSEMLDNSCVLKPKEFFLIFEKNIESQINCLELNLYNFLHYVKREKSESISKVELQLFIKKFFKNDPQTFINALDILMQLNALLFSDGMEELTIKNIPSLISLSIMANKLAVKLNLELQNMTANIDPHKLWNKRQNIERLLAEFVKDSLSITSKQQNKKTDKKIHLLHFFTKLRSALKAINFQFGRVHFEVEDIKSILFLKKMLIGGNKQTLGQDGLFNIIKRLPFFGLLTFDVLFLKKAHFENENKFVAFLITRINQLFKQIPETSGDHKLFKLTDLTDTAHFFLKDKLNIKSYHDSLLAIKNHFFLSSSSNFTYRDISIIKNDIIKVLKIIYFNNRMFSQDKEQLSILTAREVEKLKKNFSHIIRRYRFFKNRQGMSTFSKEIKRHKLGVHELTILRWGLSKLIKIYGKKNGSKKAYFLTTKNLKKILDDMRPIFERFKLGTKYPMRFAKNIMTAADIFQINSNGNNRIELDELTEYFSLSTMSFIMACKITDNLKAHCRTINKSGKKVFTRSCFNRNFYRILLNRNLQYQKYLPRLYQYSLSSKRQEFLEYSKNVQFISFDEPQSPTVNFRDLTLTLGSILSIESSFVRFDGDDTNIIEYQELLNIYDVAKKLVLDIGKIQGFFTRFAQSAFLLMIKQKRIPKKHEVLAFHFNPFARPKKIVAQRSNVVSIQKSIMSLQEKK